MFKVTVGGVNAGYSDTAVFVKLAENGCYIPCERTEAEGVCLKVAVDRRDEDGNTVTGLEDIVYRLTENGLNGVEPEGVLEETSGPLEIADAEAALEILGYKEG